MRIWANSCRFSTLLLLLGLMGCQTAGNDMPLHGLAEKAGLATPVVEAKDFVKKSHKDDGDYMAVGVTPSAGSVKVRDPKGVETLQKELEAAQKRAETNAK